MDNFELRLFLLTHLLIIKKLPTVYIEYLSQNIIIKALILIAVVAMLYFDVISALLMGLIFVFSNMEYMEREKLHV